MAPNTLGDVYFLKFPVDILLLQSKDRPANHGSGYLSLSIFAIVTMQGLNSTDERCIA